MRRKFTFYLLQTATALLLPASFCWGQNVYEIRKNELERQQALERKIATDDLLMKQSAVEQLDSAKSAAAAGTAIKYFSERELPAEEKKLITPDASLKLQYETFLQQSGTGLFKILSLQTNRVGVNDARTQSTYPQMRGSGTYYSFAKKNHLPDEWAQLHLNNGFLRIGYGEMIHSTVASSGGVKQTFTFVSGYGFGVMTALGNLPLEKINLTSAPAQYLQTLVPPDTLAVFKEKSKAYFQGMLVANHFFRAVLPAQVETTYLLRSVLYKKTDSLIAFRILKQDNDGGLHILWKQLAQFPAPEMKK